MGIETMYPTREEWEARQAAGPPGLLAILADITAERDAAERARREIQAENDRRAAENRAAFELAVAGMLQEAGLSWLAGYRLPDSAHNGDDFNHFTTIYRAGWDASAVGVHPVSVTLVWQPLSGWAFAAGCNWIAWRPDGSVCRPCPRQAVAAAAEYCRTPF